MAEQIFNNDLKTLGLIPVTEENITAINSGRYKDYIKVLLLPKGSALQVDLTYYEVEQSSLFFISPNQYLALKNSGDDTGYLVFYNRDFYCIQVHDDEVACDGLLFNNIHNIPNIALDNSQTSFFNSFFEQMIDEFGLRDVSLEEMIRTYLKQLFIKAVRVWKKQNLDKQFVEQHNDLEFFRKFSMLVEEHFKEKHNVADYAKLLFIAPKTITHKFKRLQLPPPNDVIKNRIILEAKRLLAHTSLTAREVGYLLGYEDPAYFSRLFVQKTGETPSGFRTKFTAEN